MTGRHRPILGIALGSGAAKGWAHIGILNGLAKLGIKPDLISGCSIGALVGAAYAGGNLGRLESWVRGFTKLQVMSLLDPTFSGRGLFSGDKVFNVIANGMKHKDFSETKLPFGVVATDLNTGRELWIQDGDMVSAVRASCAMPGIFVPIYRDNHLLIDGAVVNPVPVSLARAMGAEIVIAVNLAGDQPHKVAVEEEEEEEEGMLRQWISRIRPERGAKEKEPALPSMWNVMSGAINIMQERITRARMAGDPPEMELKPRVSEINIMEFHRAEEAIAEGEACVERMSKFLLAELAYLGIHPEPVDESEEEVAQPEQLPPTDEEIKP
ncbi:patatin-like phospholipase RssA [Gallaecimonas pentaromativorans]|uniref:NTE family protein n=1 Tax=Gallaecimonas pentaromativorans TaxID=584787 RepID=A0A3N1P8Z3_9GAMM|nr:patatin-like phospholipase RssA [Gallaecimonas pentaromativorans]ROQ25013.1 NTE family protein [Gallaecimonas pentaromativorans]